MAAHGSQKLFGWFGGYGIAGTGGFFETIGFRPGKLFATLAGLSEFGGGLLLALGFLGPIGPALVLSVMIVAAVTAHWGKGLFATSGGIEVPLLYASAASGLALTGPGRYSVDALVGLATTEPLALIALGIGVIGAFANLALRRKNPAVAAA
ncbi:MAG: DoxX family protein [Acidobacteriota bacterium]|nr:DoxX family protein [Acidobacteriota bacterium]